MARRKRYTCTFCGRRRVSDFSNGPVAKDLHPGGIIACSKCEREMGDNAVRAYRNKPHWTNVVYKNGSDEIAYQTGPGPN
jgi:transcription elongation factor Elf1